MSFESDERKTGDKARYVFEAITERRSIRSFTGKSVSLNDLKKLVAAAKWAPTGSNRQQWKYVIINDPKVMRKVIMISPLLRGKPAAAILICLEKARGGGSVGFPAQNIMLAAYALGLGSCAIGGFSRTAVRKILDIPLELDAQLLIALGYAADVQKPLPRRPWSETVYVNSCSIPYEEK